MKIQIESIKRVVTPSVSYDTPELKRTKKGFYKIKYKKPVTSLRISTKISLRKVFSDLVIFVLNVGDIVALSGVEDNFQIRSIDETSGIIDLLSVHVSVQMPDISIDLDRVHQFKKGDYIEVIPVGRVAGEGSSYSHPLFNKD